MAPVPVKFMPSIPSMAAFRTCLQVAHISSVVLLAQLAVSFATIGNAARAESASTDICTEVTACIGLLTPDSSCTNDCMEPSKQAAQALLRIGAPAIPALIELLDDDQLDLRWKAGLILQRIEGLGPEHLALLKEASRGDPNAGAGAIARIGTPAAIRHLVQLLEDYPIKFVTVGHAISGVGAIAVPFLLEKFICGYHCKLEYYDAAGQVLRDIGEGAAAAVAPLVAIAIDANQSDALRIGAIETLGAMGPFAEDAVPALRELAKAGGTSKSMAIEQAAMRALRHFGDSSVVARKLAELEHTNGREREFLVQELGMLGPNAIAAAPVLRTLLQDSDWDVRVAAAEALGAIGDRQAIDLLIDATASADWRLVSAAVNSLGHLHAQAAVDRLEEVGTSHWFPRVRAVTLLAMLDLAYNPKAGIADSFDALDKFLATWRVLRQQSNILAECKLGEARWNKKWLKAPILPERDSIEWALPAGAGTLIGTDYGEFGGKLIHRDARGVEHVLLEDNVLAIADGASGLVAVTGLAHMLEDYGSLLRIVPSVEGAWSAEMLATLPGEPFRMLQTEEGGLLFLGKRWSVALNTSGNLEWLPCR